MEQVKETKKKLVDQTPQEMLLQLVNRKLKSMEKRRKTETPSMKKYKEAKVFLENWDKKED